MKSVARAAARPRKNGAAPRRAPAWNNVVAGPAEGAQLKRRALITEAARAFGHRGFHNVSLDEVAVALNVSKPTLYNYVGSKYELLYECYNLALDLGDLALRKAQAESGSALDRLCSFIHHHVESLTRELGSAAVLFEFYSMLPEDRDRIQRRRRKFDKTFREMVSDGIADGSIAPCDPKLAVFWFMSAVSSIPRWFDPKGALSGEDIANAFVTFLRSGLEAKGKGSARGRTAAR